MKALTIRQPWAWAIAAGLKRVENRSWRTGYRGPIGIHAGKARCPAGVVLPDGTPVVDAELVYGAVIVVAELVDCVPVADAPVGWATPFTEGPFCWLLANVRRITPVPWVGQLQLFEVPDERLVGVVIR
jgi:hypothetical protein